MSVSVDAGGADDDGGAFGSVRSDVTDFGAPAGAPAGAEESTELTGDGGLNLDLRRGSGGVPRVAWAKTTPGVPDLRPWPGSEPESRLALGGVLGRDGPTGLDSETDPGAETPETLSQATPGGSSNLRMGPDWGGTPRVARE